MFRSRSRRSPARDQRGEVGASNVCFTRYIRSQALTPVDFLRSYETALATQLWAQVEPLMHRDVCVTFNNGTYRGKPEVQAAFTKTFALIEDEHYSISNIHWVCRDASHAVCMYHFAWSGVIHGKPASGGGRGTCVLKKEGERWLLITEHLGPHAT